ncbi:hypothetical protein BDU57DRAFT_555167 [Ampelomyces quisqualis]|uniref:Tyrosinase copper-binding domain-containing protein n=1 Tax=Ampelomyces quisqualis TaxID=50730 RepID=A0A6A5QNC1_AMPQU|nr:hypothetical protein BDU57DRAFT_555167 [Ampelomyces quisqualis]
MISAAEKKAYIAAVQCITKAPSKLSATTYPGAKTRYNDFVVIYMKNTLTIRGTGNVLSWHSETSMGSQGEKVAHNSNGLKPAIKGGVCIAKGPFKDIKSNDYGYNTRCIKRDISGYLVQRDSKYAKVAALITNSKTIGPFQDTMQAGTGVHIAGHFTFLHLFLHHSQIDRVWWIWQAQDFANKQQVIACGASMMGGGRAQSLEDNIDLEVLNVDGKADKIKELVSTIGGPFCYVYE